MKRLAFTMLELIFVIVVTGILAKFGMELLAKVYDNFIFNSVNSALQEKSQNAVEMIASRLQYRIKNSVIAREDSNDSNYTSLSEANSSDYDILEWVGSDIDGFRGTTKPLWSGIIDLDDSNATLLKTPETNTTELNNTIYALSDGNATLYDAAIYFPGSNSNVKTGYGWQRPPEDFNDQNHTMHPIQAGDEEDELAPRAGTSFSGVDVYEYYKLAWTAYAIALEEYNTTTKTGNLYLYHNYQPWKAERYNDSNDSRHKSLLMKDVSTFRFHAIGSVIQIQVCTKSNLLQDEEYSICKEKTVF